MNDAPSAPQYRASHYSGSLATVAALTASFTALGLILASNGDAISWRSLPAIPLLPAPHPPIPWVLALAVSALAAATLTTSLASLAIHVIRVMTYTIALRRYCAQELRRVGITKRRGLIALSARWRPPLASAGAHSSDGGTGRLLRHLAHARHTLLLGSEGGGKTITLLAMAQRDVAFLASVGIVLGVRRLPILISLPGVASAMAAGASAENYLARQFARLGSDGLAARVPELLKRGALTLLCDDYDALDSDGREAVNRALLGWLEPPHGRNRAMIACDSARFDEDLDGPGPLDSLTVARIEPLSAAMVSRMALLGVSGSKRRSAARAHLREVSVRSVSAMLGAPGVARSLANALASDQAPALSYSALLRQDILLHRDKALATPGAKQEGDIPDFALVWGALAASLQGEHMAALSLDTTHTMGECAARWLGEHPPLTPVSFALQSDLTFDAAVLESAIKAGIETGALRRQLDGLSLSFAYPILRKAASAYWMDMMDNGLGRLNSALLAPQWVAPVVLWAGGRPDAIDIAQRIYRLTQSPESVASRAGLSRASDVAPVALALAVAAAIEGVEPVIIATEPNDQAHRRNRFAAQQELRDLLDAMAIMASDGARRPALMVALRQARERVGPSLDASMRALLELERLDRLARAQLILALGLLATPQAVEELLKRLSETDLTIRQAARQGLIYAGAEAIPTLQRLAASDDALTRQRAGEALTFVSAASAEAVEVAGAGAMKGLGSADPRNRRVAITTLGAIRASEALDALIARLDDTSLDAQIAAARALGQLGAPAGLAALRKRVATPSPALRRAIADALGATADPESLPPLLSLLGDKDAAVRAAAASALGAQGDRRAAGPLREAAQDADPWVRRAAHAAARRLTGS